MLDGHKEVDDLDPAHSLDFINRNFPNWKQRDTVLELGVGQGRVTYTVLSENFYTIDGLEPVDYLREKAVAKMELVSHPYRKMFECTI